jgi:hypothetical protein
MYSCFLCNDRDIGGYIRPISGQWLNKHVPTATVMHAMGEMGCCLRGPCRGVIKKKTGATRLVDFCKGG